MSEQTNKQQHDQHQHGLVELNNLLHTNRFMKWFWDNPKEIVQQLNQYRARNKVGGSMPYLRYEIHRPSVFCIEMSNISFVGKKETEELRWKMCRLGLSQNGVDGGKDLCKIGQEINEWFDTMTVEQFICLLRYMLNNIKGVICEIRVPRSYAKKVSLLKSEIKKTLESMPEGDPDRCLLQHLAFLTWNFEDAGEKMAETKEQDDGLKTIASAGQIVKDKSFEVPQVEISTPVRAQSAKQIPVTTRSTSPDKAKNHHAKLHTSNQKSVRPCQHGHQKQDQSALKPKEHFDHSGHNNNNECNKKREELNQTSNKTHTEDKNTNKREAEKQMESLAFMLPVQDVDVSTYADIMEDVRHKVGDPLPDYLAQDLNLPGPLGEYCFTTKEFLARVTTELGETKSYKRSSSLFRDGNTVFRREFFFRHPAVVKTSPLF